MEGFLKEGKDIVNLPAESNTPIHVVLGNESCDLDSAVSAVVYAFFLSKLNPDSDTPIPVLNIPSTDYRLRTEVNHAFCKRGVSADVLTFRDQIDLDTLFKDGRLKLTLVDHNVLVRGDAGLEGCVVEVIDHHVQERPVSDSVAMVVELVGSCCTLIAEKMLSTADFPIMPDDVWQLLHATILLDTVNLSETAGRAKPKDWEMTRQLEAHLGGGVDRHKVFDEIQQAKLDISDLTTCEWLRKDLKIAMSAYLNIAVSSIPVHIQDLLGREQLHEDLEAFSSHHDTPVVVVMALHVDGQGEPSRQLAVFSLDEGLRSQVVEVLQSATQPHLRLTPGAPDTHPLTDTLSVMRQGNTEASCDDILSLITAHYLEEPPHRPLQEDVLSRQTQYIDVGGTCESNQLLDFDPLSGSEVASTPDLLGIGMNSDLISADDKILQDVTSETASPGNSLKPGGNTQDLLGLGFDYDTPAMKGVDKMYENNNTLDPFSNHCSVLLDVSPLDTPDVLTPDQTVSPAEVATSYPSTPPNSHMEPGSFPQVSQSQDHHLPSFNSSEMVRKIQEKKAVLTASFDNSASILTEDEKEEETAEKFPFTPQNSFSDASLIRAHHDLPSMNNADMVRAVKQKRASQAGEHGFDIATDETDNGGSEKYTFTPANSESGDEQSSPRYNLGDMDSAAIVEVVENKRASMPYQTDQTELSQSSSNGTQELLEVEMAQMITKEIINKALETCIRDDELPASSEPDLNNQEMEVLAELEDAINSADELDRSDDEEDGSNGENTAQHEYTAAHKVLGAQMYVETDYLAELDPMRGGKDIVPHVTESSDQMTTETKLADDKQVALSEDVLSPDSAIDVNSHDQQLDDSSQRDMSDFNEQPFQSDGDVDADSGCNERLVGAEVTEDVLLDTAESVVTGAVQAALAIYQQDHETSDARDDGPDTSHEQNDITEVDTNTIDISHPTKDPGLLAKAEVEQVLTEDGVIPVHTAADTEVGLEATVNKRKLEYIAPVEVPEEALPRTIVLHREQEENFPEQVISPESAHVKRKQQEPGQEAGDEKSSTWKQTLGLEWDSDDEDEDGGRGVSSSDLINISLDETDTHAVRPTTLQPSAPKKKIVPNIDLLKDDDDEMDTLSSSSSSGDDEPDAIIPAAMENIKTPDDVTTPEAMGNPVLGGQISWEGTESTPSSTPVDPIPEYTAREEFEDNRHWRSVEVGSKSFRIDMKVIEPYKKVLSHGGYYGDGFNALIVFAACYLPDRSRKDYQYVMDNLFIYVISTLELLVVEDYMIIYFHGSTPKNRMPGLRWLKRCYDMIDRRLRKNLKGLLIVHPTLWLKTVIVMTKPFISKKFSSKIHYVRSLHDLTQMVPSEYIYIPDEIKAFDRRRFRSSSVSSSAASTPS